MTRGLSNRPKKMGGGILWYALTVNVCLQDEVLVNLQRNIGNRPIDQDRNKMISFPHVGDI